MTSTDLMDVIEEIISVYGQVKASGLIDDLEKDAPVVISAVKTLAAALHAHNPTAATAAAVGVAPKV